MTTGGGPVDGVVTYAAPGRINLIGEHTDYNLGLALPIALPVRTTVTYRPDDSDAISIRSAQSDDTARVSLDTMPGGVSGWAAYPAGVVWSLREAGYLVRGGDMSITSDVEMGAGVSSSAALECAVLGAITAAGGLRIDPVEQAQIAQRAENDYVGAPTGLMDQLAAVCGRPRQAMLIDFRAVTVRQCAFDPDEVGLALLLIDSRARHRHAGGEYAARRAACERAAADLKVSSLRDVQGRGLAVLAAVSDSVDARRARHILTENQRVLDAVAALRRTDFDEFGRLLTASHESMRDDFEITTEQIDEIAAAALRAGALGARMTGGGFGGCVIALVPAARVDAVADAVRRAMSDSGHPEPTVTRTRAGTGAGSVRDGSA